MHLYYFTFQDRFTTEQLTGMYSFYFLCSVLCVCTSKSKNFL